LGKEKKRFASIAESPGEKKEKKENNPLNKNNEKGKELGVHNWPKTPDPTTEEKKKGADVPSKRNAVGVKKESENMLKEEGKAVPKTRGSHITLLC